MSRISRCVCTGSPIALCITLLALFAHAQEKKAPIVFNKGDRVAWVGSSSTAIGVWPKTMEFLLRTRHPELQLSFKKFSTGGGTFGTGAQNLDKWLGDFQPTVVVLNYGGNDAGGGEKGLAQYKENMAKCVAKIEATRARAYFSSFQAADVRKAGEAPSARRKLYAETQLAFCKEKGWPIVDVFHPLDLLQQNAQKDDDTYTILRDSIHLTNAAYIAWGYYLYDGINLAGGASALSLNADGKVLSAVRCKVEKVSVKGDEIAFVRLDEVLPILPPEVLPPRKYVPLEKHSSYRLHIAGLKEGTWEIRCEDQLLGAVAANALAKGVNLNTLLLDRGTKAPWDGLAKQIWAGKDTDQIGRTSWRFQVVRKGL